MQKIWMKVGGGGINEGAAPPYVPLPPESRLCDVHQDLFTLFRPNQLGATLEECFLTTNPLRYKRDRAVGSERREQIAIQGGGAQWFNNE